MAALGFEILESDKRDLDPQPASWRTALWLFAAMCLIYLGTARGVLDTVDDVAMLRVTEALVTTGGVAVAPDTPGAMVGPDGRWYTRYGIGQSLLALPFVLVGRQLPTQTPNTQPFDPHGFVIVSPVSFAVTLIGLLCASASVALLYLTCRELGISHLGALAAALALGMGTFAWHYARTFMSEPPSMAAASLAFFALLRFERTRRTRWALVSGTACATLLLLRIGNLVLLPVLGGYLLLLSRRATLVWLAPIVVTAAALAAFNTVRFGTPLETGYADQVQAFTTPLFVGVYGLLLSSGKGVLLYAPIVLAGVVGWFSLVGRRPRAAWALAFMTAGYIVFYARFEWWYGGGPWGPRFLTVILPYLCIGIGSLVDARLPLGARAALLSLAAVSVAIQVLSVAVPYLPYEARMMQDTQAYERLLWNPHDSPLVTHARALAQREYPLDLAFTYYPWPWLAWLQLTALLAGFGLLLAGGWSSWRAPRRRRLAMSEATPA